MLKKGTATKALLFYSANAVTNSIIALSPDGTGLFHQVFLCNVKLEGGELTRCRLSQGTGFLAQQALYCTKRLYVCILHSSVVNIRGVSRIMLLFFQ